MYHLSRYQRSLLMFKSMLRIVIAALVLLTPVVPGFADFSSPAFASSRNWTERDRSRYCSMQAQRYADRNARRTTGAGALTGAAIGGIASGSRSNTARNAGRGALIGGGAGLV